MQKRIEMVNYSIKIKYLTYPLLLISLIISCEKRKLYSEKTTEWILPAKDNFLKYKTKNFQGNSIKLSKEIFYQRLEKNQIGQLEYSTLNNSMGISELRLFQLREPDLILLKSKKSNDNYIDSLESKIYIKFPADNDTLRWNYNIDGGIVKCLSFWLQEKEKKLVVIRESYINNSVERFGKDIEYYQKGRGLTKIKLYGSTDKILMRQDLIESKIDKELYLTEFPLK